MDITPTIITTNATKSPETDTSDQHQTGASPIQSAKPLTFTNGVLKRHTQPQHRHHHHHHHPIVVTYKECLKNHAASLGVHALDGCGEFMPSPTTNPSDPTSLKCSACGCHRNFHRREPDQDHLGHAHTPTTATIEYQPLHRHHPPPPLTQPNPHVPPSQRSPNSASPPPISSSYYPPAPHALLALSGNLQQHSAAAANQEHGNINNNNNNNNNNIMMMSSSGGRKRYRTKFSQIQKEKMFEFAERVGWKMQKRDEDLVHEICNQVGVDRTVLKVWMHNNKNTFAKRDLINGGGGIGKINLDGSSSNNNNNNNSISISSKSGGDGDEDDQINGVNNNNNNNGLQNLNHQFESTAATGNVANLANANGGGGGGSSSSS